jgi:hypothetical protein
VPGGLVLVAQFLECARTYLPEPFPGGDHPELRPVTTAGQRKAAPV